MSANCSNDHPALDCLAARPDHCEIEIEVLEDLATIRQRTVVSKMTNNIISDRLNDVRWLEAVCNGLRHQPYLIVATASQKIVGMLPLAQVKSVLFGKYLTSLPYVNTAGVNAIDGRVVSLLIDRAVSLADSLKVRYLELRHEQISEHPALTETLRSKVHMRLPLPQTSEELWDGLKSKVRNKVNKGERQGFKINWGTYETLNEFHDVFSHTMRDLGTPVYGRRLFRSILDSFEDSAEFCVVKAGSIPIAAALLIHGRGSTIVPSAASLHKCNSTNANDWMYWNLLKRAVDHGQCLFDFGRCTPEGNTFTFKKKWGASPEPTAWQYYVRQGSPTDLRLESKNYDRAVSAWRKLPLSLTRVVGPFVVRGIP